MAMADSRDPETKRFAAVRATPETVNNPAPLTSGVEKGAGKGARQSGGKGPLVGLLLFLLAIVVVASIWLYSSLNSASSQNDGVVAESATATSPTVAESASNSEEASEKVTETTASESRTSPSETTSSEEPQSRPTQPSLPANASAANPAAAANTDAGNLNNVYTGSAATSPEFAQAVRDAFVNHYLETNELSGQITATSPVTGTSYAMSCEDNGEFVTCKGGNNAIVYIS